MFEQISEYQGPTMVDIKLNITRLNQAWMDTGINAKWVRESLQTMLEGSEQVKWFFPTLDNVKEIGNSKNKDRLTTHSEISIKDRGFNDLSPIQVWLSRNNKWTQMKRQKNQE